MTLGHTHYSSNFPNIKPTHKHTHTKNKTAETEIRNIISIGNSETAIMSHRQKKLNYDAMLIKVPIVIFSKQLKTVRMNITFVF